MTGFVGPRPPVAVLFALVGEGARATVPIQQGIAGFSRV